MSGAAWLRAPVINLTGAEGVQALTDYMAHLVRTPEADVVDYEATRVMPYMAALGNRLQAAHQNTPEQPPFKRAVVDYHQLGGWRVSPEALYDQKRLTGMFNQMAADTGTIILSEVGMASTDVLNLLSHSEQAQSGDIQFFSKGMDVNGFRYQLGFIQCYRPSDGASVAFPLMGLDKRVMEMFLPDDSINMLDSLSGMATAGNHDVLHHLTSTELNSNINRQRAEPDYAPSLNMLLESYLVFDDDRPHGYESWALVSHAATWRELRETPEAINLQIQTDRYYDAIERLNQALIEKNTGDVTRYRTIDYLSTIGAYSLLRIVPLTDPLMERVLMRMEKLSSSDDATLAWYMRERHRNAQTKYPERANLPDLQALYLALLERPGFVIRKTEMDIGAALAQNLRYELEKPVSARNPALMGAGRLNLNGPYEEAAPEMQSDMLQLMKALGQVHFDDGSVLADLAEVPEYRRNFILNEMRNTREQTVTTLFRVVQAYLHGNPFEDDFQDNIHRLGIIHFDGLRRQADSIDHQSDPHSLAYQTARNYKAAGYDILGPEGTAPNWRQIKMWDLIRTLPMIAYMGSPAADDEHLSQMHRISETVDRGVVNIVGGVGKPSLTPD